MPTPKKPGLRTRADVRAAMADFLRKRGLSADDGDIHRSLIWNSNRRIPNSLKPQPADSRSITVRRRTYGLHSLSLSGTTPAIGMG